MKSATVREWVVFVVLVALGVLGRWAFEDVPNFTPTVGIAVFAGLYFSRPALAALAPIAVMVVSNVGLQSYGSWVMLAVVYGSLLFPVILSRVLGKTDGDRRRLRPLGMLACGVLPSAFFFATTNFAVWLGGGIYARTFSGLSECYLRAIPFYPASLVGDLVFVGAAILTYEAILHFLHTDQSVAVEN
ncbi:MAG: hypothetical protein P8K78_05990 [Pirellulales bacterium]|nr:hypothetical protein [Pirellulales bacterium]